jgi:hypothetical protein
LALRLREREKAFFFEKKKQKTFAMLSRTARQRTFSWRNFFVHFFKKERFAAMVPQLTHP